MAEAELERIKQRLYQLEKQNRRLKVLGVISVLFVAVALLAGASQSPQPKVMKVRGLVVVDDQDKTRAELFADSKGTRLWLNDPNENLRVSLFAFADRANIGLHDDRFVRAAISSAAVSSGESQTVLVLSSGNMRNSAYLSVSNDGHNLSLQESEAPGKEVKTIWRAP